LALTLEFYESKMPDLRPGRENWLRKTVLPALETVAEVRFDQAVYRREDVDNIVREFERDGVEVLLVVCLTYSPSLLSLPALQHTSLPIVVWNTQELFAVDADFDGKAMIANHGVHGTQDLCNVLARGKVPFEYITSHLNDSDAIANLAEILTAGAAVSRLRHTRLGLMGYPFPGMGDMAVDTAHLANTLGCQSISIAVEELNERAEAVGGEEVLELTNVYRQTYLVADDIVDEDLEATARVELALRSMVADYRLDAVTYQFLALGESEQTMTLPFVAAGRLMAEGIGFGGEGDLVAATGSWFLNQLAPPATFSEVFTTDFGGNALLMSHMGEANAAMARSDCKIRLVARQKGIVPTRRRQLALAVSLEPGPATLCCLTLGAAGRWRMITGRVEVADFGPLEPLTVPHFKLRIPNGDVRQWLTAYAKAGGAHHNAVCFGDATAKIRSAAGLLGADYIEIS
jgi:L-arabinose isomerase